MFVNKLREILRLILTTVMSNRAIDRATGVSFNTVRRIRTIVLEKRLDWPSFEAMDDEQLEATFRVQRTPWKTKLKPDVEHVRTELQKPNVTKRLLWEEYREAGGNYSESQFNHIVQKYLDRLDLTMRKVYVAGEWAFADYAGDDTLYWIDAETGEKHHVQVFAAVLGCSSYSFAYATASQSTQDTIEATVRFWEFCGGSTQYLCTDNLKAVVIKPGRDPEINRAFQEMVRHYGSIVIPARIRTPEDKGKVEVGVQVVERWILARLRNRHFNSLAEINAAIADLLPRLNTKPFRHLEGCRQSHFEKTDRPALKPLPVERFVFGEWTGQQKVGPDYHVKVKGHFYSVHHSLVTEYVEARATVRTVEVFHRGKRVASHPRSEVIGGQTTLPEHRPAAHRAYAEQSPDRYLEWAKSIGPGVTAAVQYQLDSRERSPLALRACSSLQRLAKDYTPERLEAACQRGQRIRSLTLKSIGSILQRRLESAHEPEASAQLSLPLHENVRGAQYYT
jgi:transposase